MPEPERLPAWLTEADLDVYADAFERTVFPGALNRHRNMDADWAESAGAPARVSQPARFLAGERDSAVVFGSVEPMKRLVPGLRRTVIFPGCGQWVQQERPEEVNRELATFLLRELLA